MSCNDILKNAADFIQAGGGNDDGIATAIGVFRDAKKSTTRILAQVENKRLSLDGDIFTFQNGIHP